jgi:signal transduction histidine kinase
MSHELKTPLVVVIGYAELLKSQTIGALNNPQQNALERMLGCGRETHRLPVLSRYFSRGRLTVKVEPLHNADSPVQGLR